MVSVVIKEGDVINRQYKLALVPVETRENVLEVKAKDDIDQQKKLEEFLKGFYDLPSSAKQ